MSFIFEIDDALRLVYWNHRLFDKQSAPFPDSSSVFHFIHHVKCACTVLLTDVLRSRRAHSACKGAGSAHKARIIWWLIQDS
ncbi:unnamed protein product [Albugo candida]|uniref:Uncharacterized protein n=1 Tax=Albugo candida TaxID=65357 RepID=A0A024FW13_9STRA|nr:unnamed protein product [Albugo candida]|eukprot:CCI11315.1 unnamed protein product [Albugo candida]